MNNLVVGNHTYLTGIIEQIVILLRVFEKTGEPVSITPRIVPNETNILIEDFNSSLVAEMNRIKQEYPNTKYILYATEYLTHLSTGGWGTLNVFSKKTGVIRTLYNLRHDIIGDRFSQFLGQNFSAKIRSLSLYFDPLLDFASRACELTHGIEIMMAKREKNINALVGKFDLVIANTNAVLNNYDQLLDCPISLLPTFIDLERASHHRALSTKYPTIFFSGRKTPHRTKTLRGLGQALENPYPMQGGPAWYPGSPLADTMDKIDILNRAFKNSAANLPTMELPPISVNDINIYSYLKTAKTAAFEIYVPQSKNWRYSSPNRTLLSVESGFIPIDYGHFTDHDINAVALSVTSTAQLNNLLSRNLTEVYIELDQRIASYNALQESHTSEFASKLKLL